VIVTLIAIGALGVVFFGTAGTASAAKVNCSGQLLNSAKAPKSKTDLDYTFTCDQNVLAYTLTFSAPVLLFEPEVLAIPPSGEGGELVSCEGGIPTRGLGCTAQSSVCPSQAAYTACTGKVTAGNRVTGGIETENRFCPKITKKGKQKGKRFGASLSVSTIEFTASGKTFVQSSEPIDLAKVFKCKKPKK
jgi:hypothetical protein